MGRFSTASKMAAIGFLTLALLVPLVMVQSVLQERLERRNEAVTEITATWGGEQVVLGPVLVLPHKDGRAFFLPATFKAEVTLDPQRLHRGIYESVVYGGTIHLTGIFAQPSFDGLGIDPMGVRWDEAQVVLAVSDLRGAKEALALSFSGVAVALEPGSGLDGFPNGVHARLKGIMIPAGGAPFDVTFTVNGSRGLRFAPVGVGNDIVMASSWPDPSFQGAFLPTRRDVGPAGFTARWQMSYYGRSYPQQWTDRAGPQASSLKASLFGVDLVKVVDSYRYVERSIKYGVLVIALTFTAFFLVEVLAAFRIHPFQYALVGAALCLFYLGLLALSEVLPFGAAYWTGAAAAIVTIALYAVKALKSGARGVTAGAGLTAVYGFLYVVLRLQDYSLLVGTAGLFLVLALVMYVTREIDWYARDAQR
jgi:inner membrane protein